MIRFFRTLFLLASSGDMFCCCRMLYDDLSEEEDDDGEDLLSPNLDRLEELQAERRRGRPQDDDTWGPPGGATEADEDSGDYAGDSDDYSF